MDLNYDKLSVYFSDLYSEAAHSFVITRKPIL